MADLLTKAVMKNISNKTLNKTCKKEEYKKVENITSKEDDILKSILYKSNKKIELPDLKTEKDTNNKIELKSLNTLSLNSTNNKSTDKVIDNKQFKNMISLKDLAR